MSGTIHRCRRTFRTVEQQQRAIDVRTCVTGGETDITQSRDTKPGVTFLVIVRSLSP